MRTAWVDSGPRVRFSSAFAILAILYKDSTNFYAALRISTNYEELTGNWANHPGRAPTQELGQALYNLPGLEGFVFPSSLVNESCLAIFPDKLGPRSSVLFRNEMDHDKVERLT